MAAPKGKIISWLILVYSGLSINSWLQLSCIARFWKWYWSSHQGNNWHLTHLYTNYQKGNIFLSINKTQSYKTFTLTVGSTSYRTVVSRKSCLTDIPPVISMLGQTWITYVIGGSRGARPARAPLRVQILSFWHAKFSKHSRLGGPRPPPTRSTPPLWEILDPPLYVTVL